MIDKAECHSKRIMRLFERDLWPWLGDRPIAEISPQELLKTVLRIEERGAVETAHRALQYLVLVFRFAVARQLMQYNPAEAIRGSLSPYTTEHYPNTRE